MTIAEQIKGIIAALADWQKQFGGSVKIAHDVPHLVKILGENPGAVRAAVLFAGETIRDDRNADVIGRVDRKFWIAFSRGYVLESYAGKSLVEGIEGKPALFDIIDAAIAPLRRATLGTDDEPVPYYKGVELLTFQDMTLDAMRIEIEVAADRGDLTADDLAD
jgi:hypothetical protein